MDKPTIEDIAAFCKERGNNIDPEQFYYFYESKGWKIGRSPMKSWEACVRTWERNTTHSMAVKQRDEAVRVSKKVIYSKPLPKKPANPKIAKLAKESIALGSKLRNATADQRREINKRVMAICKEIQMIRDEDMRIKL